VRRKQFREALEGRVRVKKKKEGRENDRLGGDLFRKGTELWAPRRRETRKGKKGG